MRNIQHQSDIDCSVCLQCFSVVVFLLCSLLFGVLHTTSSSFVCITALIWCTALTATCPLLCSCFSSVCEFDLWDGDDGQTRQAISRDDDSRDLVDMVTSVFLARRTLLKVNAFAETAA